MNVVLLLKEINLSVLVQILDKAVCILQALQLNDNTYPYLPNPSAQAGYDTRSIFKWSLTGLNSEFSFS